MFQPSFATALALGVAVLAGCGGEPSRYAVNVPPPEARLRISAGSVEVREVTLPLYAELEEIYVANETGALVSDTDVLWADDPTRAITRGLAAALAAGSGKPVAAEPWPFQPLPDARLDVRFDRVLADSTGRLHLSGQYFVASVSESSDPVARRFDLSVAYVPGDPVSLADAQGRALGELATLIARGGL